MSALPLNRSSLQLVENAINESNEAMVQLIKAIGRRKFQADGPLMDRYEHLQIHMNQAQSSAEDLYTGDDRFAPQQDNLVSALSNMRTLLKTMSRKASKYGLEVDPSESVEIVQMAIDAHSPRRNAPTHVPASEKHGYAKPMGITSAEADEIVGGAGSNSRGNTFDLYLYGLSDYDENFYGGVPLKKGEKLFRFKTDRTQAAEPDSRYLVKINLAKDLLYFLSEQEPANERHPGFQTRGIKLDYVNLFEDTWEPKGNPTIALPKKKRIILSPPVWVNPRRNAGQLTPEQVIRALDLLSHYDGNQDYAAKAKINREGDKYTEVSISIGEREKLQMVKSLIRQHLEEQLGNEEGDDWEVLAYPNELVILVGRPSVEAVRLNPTIAIRRKKILSPPVWLNPGRNGSTEVVHGDGTRGILNTESGVVEWEDGHIDTFDLSKKHDFELMCSYAAAAKGQNTRQNPHGYDGPELKVDKIGGKWGVKNYHDGWTSSVVMSGLKTKKKAERAKSELESAYYDGQEGRHYLYPTQSRYGYTGVDKATPEQAARHTLQGTAMTHLTKKGAQELSQSLRVFNQMGLDSKKN